MTAPRIVRMANQIAASVPVRSRAAELTAAHLRNFWAPSMIDELHAMVVRDPDLVTEPVREALRVLRGEGASQGPPAPR